MDGRVTRILIADDNRDTCHYIEQTLRIESDLPLSIVFAYDRDDALAKIRHAETPFDIVIADLWMPDANNIRDEQSGLKILAASLAQKPPAEVLLITGNSSADSALRASLTGAREYLLKPIDYERLTTLVREIVAERRLPLPDPVVPEGPNEVLTPLIGSSPAMIAVMKVIGRLAPTEMDVLIVGESGSGKELVARTIHANSPRKQGRFVPVNCSAIPDNLIEAELFGIGRRVATEVDAREGKFMEAHGGTLFLDEIGEISLDVQPKLLRAIEQKELQRVGGETVHANVRIIAATNRSLEQAVSEGRFRRDLYYRLTGAVIRLPPLRERKEDIPTLAAHFLRRSAARLRKQIVGFADDVVPYLMSRSWQGNVRELERAVEMAALACSGPLVRVEHFASNATTPVVGVGSEESLPAFLDRMSSLTLDEATREFERLLIERVLEQTGGNVTRTAKRLDIGRTALHRKMNQLGIRRGDESER